MTLALTALQWVATIVLSLFALMMLGMGGKVPAVLLLLTAFVMCPLIVRGAARMSRRTIPWWGRVMVVVLLLSGVPLSLRLNPATSIYKSEHYRAQLDALYNEKLAQWPTPSESRFIDTEYGKVHVIVSGPEEGYPVLLINASGVAGWSWMFNVGALNATYRTYAVDNVGEAGKNTLPRPGHIPQSGEQIAAYYADICDKLGIPTCHVAGASIGGFIATQFAIHAPHRVNRLVLLGSMGYGFTAKTIATMMVAQGFPIRPIQEATFRWAFGDAPHVAEAFGPWFRLVMKGMVPTPIPPQTVSLQQLRRVQAPTLSYIGTRDGVVGDAEAARQRAREIPDVRIRMVDSGHLIGAELAPVVNQEMVAFLDSAHQKSVASFLSPDGRKGE